MKPTLSVVCAAALGIAAGALAPEAQARWFNPVGVGVYGGLGRYGYGGYGYGGYGWGGGTPAGNYMQGMSQVIRSQGQYNEQTSRAMINYEDARTKYIDNQKKWTETYFAMRELNDSKQAEKRERNRHSPETLTLAARSSAPGPLSSEVLDPLTGKLHWPDVLQAPEYAGPRTRIEQLFEVRASTGVNNGHETFLATQQMIEILKSNIQTLPANSYIAARKFLDSLAYSARS